MHALKKNKPFFQLSTARVVETQSVLFINIPDFGYEDYQTDIEIESENDALDDFQHF